MLNKTPDAASAMTTIRNTSPTRREKTGKNLESILMRVVTTSGNWDFAIWNYAS